MKNIGQYNQDLSVPRKETCQEAGISVDNNVID